MSVKKNSLNLLERLSCQKRILIFSPHPDDDCIGMGSAIFSLSQNNRIKTVYMTSGWRGVGGNITVSEKKLLRKKEALEACRILGLNKKHIKFLNLPFYDTGKIGIRDVDLLRVEIEKFRPQIIFACGESNDPHRTHGKCLKILEKALKRLKFSPRIIFYRVWEDFKEFNLFLPFGKKIMQKKIEAIKAHKSQLIPKFSKRDISSFWKREEKLNKKFAAMLRNRGLLRNTNFLFSEVFKACPANPEKYGDFRDKK